MSTTFYKYADQNASSAVNWAAIGTDISGMLTKEVELREQKKAAIDAASRDFGNTLENAPQGEHRGINEWWLTHAANAQSYRLMQDKMLKSGKLSLKDYNIGRQNLKDGTAQVAALVASFQKDASEKMARLNANQSQPLETYLMSEAEGFGDFNTSELYINPTNGSVSIGKKVKKVVDGHEVYVMDKNPNSYTSISALQQRIKARYDRFDVDGNLNKGVKYLGKELQAVRKYGDESHAGSISEVLDIRRRGNFGVDAKSAVSAYERAEKLYLESLTGNPLNVSSILTAYVINEPTSGEAYTFTWDKSEQGGNKILLKNDPSGKAIPEFTPEQKKVADDALRARFRIMLDSEVKMQSVNEPRPDKQPQYEWQTQEARDKTKAETERIKVQTENERKNGGAGKVEDDSDVLPSFQNYIDKNITNGLSGYASDKDAAKALGDVLTPLGYTVEAKGIIRDIVKVSIPPKKEKGKTVSAEFNIRDADVADQIKKFLTGSVDDNLDAIAMAYGQGAIPSVKSNTPNKTNNSNGASKGRGY